jgi:DNA polymerase I
MPKTLYLIDGHALAYRTYFALTGYSPSGSRWQTSKGEPTAGIYGFATVMMRLLEHEKPDYIAVAFDVGKTFRDDIFPAYKGTRAKMPDDLRPQIARIRQLVDAFNIPRLEMEGFEADDVLGTIAKATAAQGIGVKIITGDRDLLQLVGDHIIVSLPQKGKISESEDYISDEQVKAYFGVPPRLVVDYKALLGDVSDNIPGVKGVGEKTARALYETFASLDDLYEHLDQVPPKVRTKLEEGRQMAYMSRELAAIRTDLNIQLDLEQARPTNFDPAKVEDFFRELEFRSLIPRVAGIAGKVATPTSRPGSVKPGPGGQMSFFETTPAYQSAPPPSTDTETRIIDSAEKLSALVDELEKAEVISFDTETTSTSEMRAEIVGISLAVEAGIGYYIPVGHSSGGNLSLDAVLAALKSPLTNPNIPKIGHNIKYDALVLARFGLQVAPLAFDTMLAEWLLDPGSRNLGLKNLSLARLGLEMTHIEDLIGKGKNQISMADVPVENTAPYAAADADMTLRLKSLLEEELQQGGLMDVFQQVEMPLVPVLAQMEMNGIRLDLDFFHTFAKELNERITDIEKRIYEAVGTVFNINSTQQLSKILFERLRLTPPGNFRKTASGHYSTSADVLEELRGQHEVVDLVLEQRELTKLKSTYVDALPEAVDPVTGRVHTSFNQSGSVTGRLSSSNPNLQNIPIRTDLGRRVRNGFIAEDGNVLLSVDYSQIELRIVAHISGDETMLEAFRQGQDIHATTAAAIYSIPLEQVNKAQRRHAKAINFGLIYGMSAFGLTRSSGLTLGESENFVKAYFVQFPGVKKYLDETRKLATEQGFVETLLGRRRYFPVLKSQINHNVRQREEREAINAPIQGTAADIMKIAMLKIGPALSKAGLKGQMLLQVHDEIVIECPKQELQETAKLVKTVMSEAYPLSIPLSTEARSGYTWGEMKVLD